MKKAKPILYIFSFTGLVLLGGCLYNLIRIGSLNRGEGAALQETNTEMLGLHACIEQFKTETSTYPNSLSQLSECLKSKLTRPLSELTNDYFYLKPKGGGADDTPIVFERLGRHRFHGDSANVLFTSSAIGLYDESNGSYSKFLKEENVELPTSFFPVKSAK